MGYKQHSYFISILHEKTTHPLFCPFLLMDHLNLKRTRGGLAIAFMVVATQYRNNTEDVSSSW